MTASLHLRPPPPRRSAVPGPRRPRRARRRRLAPRVPARARRTDLPAAGRARRRRRVDATAPASSSSRRSGDGRVIALRAPPRPRRLGRRGRARAPVAARGRLPLGAARRRRARPRRRDAPRRGRDRDPASSASASSARRSSTGTQPRLLRDVGRSADRFGHPYTPLQPGEIDQGQFDRVLEVLCVSSCAMLISRDAWQRVGLFDERLDADHEDLDLCWRARLAGFRVLMTPLARARHRDATATGERPPPSATASRATTRIARRSPSMLKNYGLLSLLWVLPLGVPLGAVPPAVPDARPSVRGSVGPARGVGMEHRAPPGHARGAGAARRRSARSRIAQLRRFMESAGLRLPRWFQTAERILEEQREIEDEDDSASAVGPPAARSDRLARRHAPRGRRVVPRRSWSAAVAIRGLLGPEALAGGVLPSFPALARRASSASWSPAIGPPGSAGRWRRARRSAALAGLSWLTFASTAHRAEGAAGRRAGAGRRPDVPRGVRAGRPGRAPRCVAAAARTGCRRWCCGPSREGRIGLLVALARAARRSSNGSRPRSARTSPPTDAGGSSRASAVTLAVGDRVLPGRRASRSAVARRGASSSSAPSRGRGLALASRLAVVGAAVLLFPFVPTLVAGGGAALRLDDRDAPTSSMLARLALGGGPGTWVGRASFLPIAAVLPSRWSGAEYRGRASRAAVTAIAGLGLAWLSAAG